MAGVLPRDAMHLLLVHQNFPGQFRELAPAWLAAGHRVSAIGTRAAEEFASPAWTGLDYHPYSCAEDCDQADAFRQHALHLRRHQRLNPDLVIAHSGWGEAEPIKDIWPKASLIVYPELWGSARALGVGFDHLPVALSADDQRAITTQNQRTARAIRRADAVVVPTRFQRDSFPEVLRQRCIPIHEGVNTTRLQPDPQARLQLPDGRSFSRHDRVITFASRRFEPLRGLRPFMAALPPLLAADPELQVLMVGGSGDGYGIDDGSSIGFEHERLHRLGALPYPDLLRLFQISRAHVYLTYPYTLSWSLLEAMACATPVISNHSGPVAEVIASGRNGLLIDFNRPDQLRQALQRLLAAPELAQALGAEARRTVQRHFSLPLALARYGQLFQALLESAMR